MHVDEIKHHLFGRVPYVLSLQLPSSPLVNYFSHDASVSHTATTLKLLHCGGTLP